MQTNIECFDFFLLFNRLLLIWSVAKCLSGFSPVLHRASPSLPAAAPPPPSAPWTGFQGAAIAARAGRAYGTSLFPPNKVWFFGGVCFWQFEQLSIFGVSSLRAQDVVAIGTVTTRRIRHLLPGCLGLPLGSHSLRPKPAFHLLCTRL